MKYCDPDELISRLEHDGDVSDVSALLEHFLAGYDTNNLKRLLESNNEKALEAGVWLASELGAKACPLLPCVSRLLNHVSSYIKLFALDVVLLCAHSQDSDILADAIALLLDVDDTVRWKAMNFVARADVAQLCASATRAYNVDLQKRTIWLVDLQHSRNRSAAILQALESPKRLERLFAAAAAARHFKDDTAPLEAACFSQDPEVSSFAKDFLAAERV